MDGVSTSPIRSTVAGMTNFTPRCVAGWCGWTPSRQGGWLWIRTSLWTLGSCGRIKCDSRVGIVRRIRFAIHESTVALVRAGVSGRVPWHQSGHGVVVCRGPGTPGEESASGPACVVSHCFGACGVDWCGGPGGESAAGSAPGVCGTLPLCCGPGRFWSHAASAGAASTLGRDAGGFSGSHAVVVSDGLSTWGGVDVGALTVAVAGRRRIALPPHGGFMAAVGDDLCGTCTRRCGCAYPQPLSGDQCCGLAGVLKTRCSV